MKLDKECLIEQEIHILIEKERGEEGLDIEIEGSPLNVLLALESTIAKMLNRVSKKNEIGKNLAKDIVQQLQKDVQLDPEPEPKAQKTAYAALADLGYKEPKERDGFLIFEHEDEELSIVVDKEQGRAQAMCGSEPCEMSAEEIHALSQLMTELWR